MKQLKKPLLVLLSALMLLVGIPLAGVSVPADSDEYVADLPESEGVRNTLLNVELLTGITFTPLESMPQKNGNFAVGVQQSGIPYSSSRVEEGFVPNFVSLYTFMSAVKNPNSYLYTVDLAQAYGNLNGTTYYGVVCSTFCAYALNIVPNYTTHQWQDIPGMELVPEQTVDALKLGDTVCHTTSGHVVMVTGITRNSLGQVVDITISEAAGSRAVTRKPITAEKFVSTYPTDVYSYHRYSKIDEVVHIPYEDIDYNTEMIPRKGDKANWLKGVPVEIDLLAKKHYTSVEIYKDDQLYDTIDIGGTRFPTDRRVYLQEWTLQPDSTNRAVTAMVALQGDLLVTVAEGAEVTFDYYNSAQESIGSADVWYTGTVTMGEVAPEGTALFRPVLRWADDSEIADVTLAETMVSVEMAADFGRMPVALENHGLSSSTGNEINTNTRCRSPFIPLQDVAVHAEEGVQYYVYYYDENLTYLTTSGGWLSGTTHLTSRKPVGAAYYRLVVRKADNSVIEKDVYGVYAAQISTTVYGGVYETPLDVLVLENLEEGRYQARMFNDTEASGWCYWMVVDANATALVTDDCREVEVTFSSTNAQPLFVKWSGGVDNGSKHVNLLTEEQIAAGRAVVQYDTWFNDRQNNQYKIRVAFQTEYGIIHTPLQEAVTVKAHQYDYACDPTCNHCGEIRTQLTHVYSHSCDPTCNNCKQVRTELVHTYDNDCDTACNNCGLVREVGEHLYETTVTAPTCEADGYTLHVCSICNYCYRTDEVPALGHAYDDDWDDTCNVCGAFDPMSSYPIVGGSTMISEDVSGLAFKFDVRMEGLIVVDGNRYLANYTDAYVMVNSRVGKRRVVSMGVVVSNTCPVPTLEDAVGSTTTATIEVTQLWSESIFAVRVVDIPAYAYKHTVYARPYFVYLDEEGNEVVCYGETQRSSYNEALNKTEHPKEIPA